MTTTLKPLKIGKYTIKYPIFQGGMGVGISWDELAGNVSKQGALGIISAVGTGYYKKMSFVEKIVASKPFEAINFYSKVALNEIFKNARKICGDSPLGANILYAISEYGRVVRDACEAGANLIVTGAGLPTNMPEFVKNFPDVALIPIVSSAKALKILCRRWQDRYGRVPDAVIVEGPLSGGHQGFKYEDCFKEEFQLENILPKVASEAKLWGNIPVIAAGGVWDRADINRMMDLGASGVQMATRFLGTYECDAKAYQQILPSIKKEDIILIKSPVGYPARALNIGVIERLREGNAPLVRCVSNCVSPCQRGKEAKIVGYCIADSLGRGHLGNLRDGLYFSGANGYRIDKIVSVRELIEELVRG
ncbi:nitronate monooxygenase [Helicobacter mustelae]|uniref:Putative 2-nitropropane dioxygenase, NPD n=1 Tax=Helicobacter mustelae (strain ATCC 43772 / CCUG 25715 / CIP 103759 / LMG 18044 / NCTC 12198 / R85-136P) TaxID=679897 RepID=D3UH84_HELM1|nr:nitronate monooxygenase [Helicobacter mustelae]CBG39856.1 Putative 2-nitropropane dioxygenase, NPD [Helicobacter mustelae 12198]SQH71365.1 2-nitropropane dioxygenase [Helicobacter mustelae]STP12492.1 2-nitropropane dioxygenase [Helicobacter mustelae]